MQLFKLFPLTCIFTFLLGGLPQNAFALDLSLTARAEAGLDPATREFINSLPNTWRPQLAKIVDDTMNRVDVSVADYLQQVDKLISNQIIDLQCHLLATQKGMVDDIVKRLPWAKEGGAVEKLRETIAAGDARRKPDSSPIFVKTLYVDYIMAAAIVSCQAGKVVPAQIDVQKIIDDYGGRWLVWNRAQNFKCATARVCVSDYIKEVGDIIRIADTRDVKLADAKTTFDAIDKPDRNWLKELVAPSDFDKFESVLTNLYKIENTIGAAKAIREASAIKKLKMAQASVDNATKKIDASLEKVKPYLKGFTVPIIGIGGGGMIGFGGGGGPRGAVVIRISCQEAFTRSGPELTASRAILDEAKKNLVDALGLAKVIGPDVEGQLVKVDTQLNRTKDASTFCKIA
jgi:hypothetical protein